MSILLEQKSLCWIPSVLLCLVYVSTTRCGWAAQATDVTLVVDTSHSAGKIDLTRYALGQGGFTYRPMIDGVIPQIAQLHPQTIRLFVQEYFNLYPDHGHCHWETLDRAIDAILATGAKLIMKLCFKPKILFPRIDERLVRPTSWAEWDRLIFRLVKHCNDEKKYGIEYWEIANEPNIPNGGGTPYNFTPQEYLDFYTHTANAIRRADSSAKVGGPALATWHGGPLLGSKSPILDNLIDYCGTGRAPLDFISWHLYDNHPELFRKEIEEVQKKLAKYASLRNVETILDEWNLSLGNPMVNPAYQPAFILENTYGFYKAGLSRSSYYQIKDEFFDAKLFWTFMPIEAIPSQEHFFNVLPIYLGLYDLQGRVRPSYYAFKLLSLIKGERLHVTGASGGVKILAARDKNLVHVIFWNFPENEAGKTREVTIQIPHQNSGRFHLTRLDPESPVNNLKMVRNGSIQDLQQNLLRVAVHPYEIY